MQFIHMKGIYYRLTHMIVIIWILYQLIWGGKYWIDTWFNPPYASVGNIDVFAKGQILIYWLIAIANRTVSQKKFQAAEAMWLSCS